MADPAVANVLQNAVAQGYTITQPKEVHFAIWNARGAIGAPQPGGIGNQIAHNATPATPPAGGTPVIDAVKNNQVKATASVWQGLGEKHNINNLEDFFKGLGQITLEIIPGQSLTLYMLIGTVFPAPSADLQSMAGYATNVSVTSPQGQQQAIPDTGISDLSSTQLQVISLISLNIAAIGVLQGRMRMYL